LTLNNRTTTKDPSGNQTTEQRRIRIVAHYRRGDTDTTLRDFMATHPSWFFHIFASLGHIFPGAMMHAFTSCWGPEMCHTMNALDVLEWEAHGITLHVDDEKHSTKETANQDWERAVAHMATADVFIMAKSALSNIAAYFNGNCVLRSPLDSQRAALSNWILVNEPPFGSDHDRSYAIRGHNIDEKVYNSRYNTSRMSIAGENPKLPFVLQLRRSLSRCLSIDTAALALSEEQLKTIHHMAIHHKNTSSL
jgi:hypothetical protein